MGHRALRYLHAVRWIYEEKHTRPITSAIVVSTAPAGTPLRVEEIVVELGFLGRRTAFEHTFLTPMERDRVPREGYSWIDKARLLELEAFANAALTEAVGRAGGWAMFYKTHVATAYPRSGGECHARQPKDENATITGMDDVLKEEYRKAVNEAFGEYRKPSKIDRGRL
jgi:hypothetical protein